MTHKVSKDLNKIRLVVSILKYGATTVIVIAPIFDIDVNIVVNINDVNINEFIKLITMIL